MDQPEVSERRIVIAIDYGTTSTGIAIATPAGNRANLSEIDIITNWGPGVMSNLRKVSSLISYPLRQWGEGINPDAVAMVHTKLQLQVHKTSEELDLILEALDGMRNLDFRELSATGNLPLYTCKGPDDIVEDYLTEVFGSFIHAIEEVATLPPEVRARIPADIVLTIPAGWSYRAQNSLFRAITRAGFNKETFPMLRDTMVISEPEAAAVYTARYLKEQARSQFLEENDCFVLCDAGGGTVDVVSYMVKQLEPTFEIERITLPSGYKCGSIFIDMAFKKWLKDLLGAVNYRELDQGQFVHQIGSHDAESPQMRELMKKFNIRKKQFKKDDQREIKLDLPAPLNNLDIDDRVVEGEITIKYADMKSFFEPRVSQIIQLITDQVEEVEKKRRRRVKNVFLVGGFAESEYLQESIRFSLGLRKWGLRMPDTSWTAVVRGAAIWGIEKPTSTSLSTMIACPRYYGIVVGTLYSDIENDTKEQVRDLLAETLIARGQIIWVIKKGDLILSNKPNDEKIRFTMHFSEADPRRGSIPIYSYDREDVPDKLSNSLAELTPVQTLEYDLQSIPLDQFERRLSGGKVPYYVARLNLTMRLERRLLRVHLCFKETTLRRAEIPWIE